MIPKGMQVQDIGEMTQVQYEEIIKKGYGDYYIPLYQTSPDGDAVYAILGEDPDYRRDAAQPSGRPAEQVNPNQQQTAAPIEYIPPRETGPHQPHPEGCHSYHRQDSQHRTHLANQRCQGGPEDVNTKEGAVKVGPDGVRYIYMDGDWISTR